MNSEQHQILAQFDRTADASPGQGMAHAFDELGASLQAVSALRTYFDKLSDVAPPSIEDQARIVAQSYNDGLRDEAAEASNPLGAMMSGLMTSAESSSQMSDLNSFALRHCGHSV